LLSGREDLRSPTVFVRAGLTETELEVTMVTSPSNTRAGYKGISLTELLQDCFACGVITVDSRGKVAGLTPLAQAFIGSCTVPQSTRKAGLPEALESIVGEAQKSGQWVPERQVELRSQGQSGRTVRVMAVPMTSGGKIPGVVLLLKDLSATRELERHLQWLDRLAGIGTLSATIAHEIRNALVPIKTFVGLILEKNPDTELAGAVRREIERVDAIVGRVLRFAAPAPPAFGTVRLHEVLEHALHLVEHRVEGRKVAFQRQFNASSDACRGDDHQLAQAFLNLLVNAVEALGAGGALTVSTDVVARDPELPPAKAAQAARFLCVKIHDTGSGIAPEHLSNIFKPFFTTKPQGTGLGLAVTHRVIEEHHGAIRVASQPGQGTTFSVFLPSVPPS
jgi:signal transduction histidine kinase